MIRPSDLTDKALSASSDSLPGGARTAELVYSATPASRAADLARFLKYVEITPTCWLWPGTFYTQFGKPTYGQFWLHGRRMGAHRASYLMHKGHIPADLDCMHSCDVKACVNPDHLSTGTRSRNLRDGFKAHPGVCAGENHGRARLTWPQVDAIRAMAASGARFVDIAPMFGVSPTAVSMIVRGLRWTGADRAAKAAVA